MNKVILGEASIMSNSGFRKDKRKGKKPCIFHCALK